MAEKIDVRLSWSQMYMASDVGLRRHLSAVKTGRKDAHDFDGDPWGGHIEGACGEFAVARAFNRHWCGHVGRVDTADVGDWQVRTSSGPGHRLILRPGDDDDAAFILVTGRAPGFRVHGWIYGRDGKLPEFWTAAPRPNRPPAFFVPQSRLRPVEELP